MQKNSAPTIQDVASHAGVSIITVSNPMLTTVQLSIPDMASAMVQAAMQAPGGGAGKVVSLVFPPSQLLQRESVAPPPLARRARTRASMERA